MCYDICRKATLLSSGPVWRCHCDAPSPVQSPWHCMGFACKVQEEVILGDFPRRSLTVPSVSSSAVLDWHLVSPHRHDK